MHPLVDMDEMAGIERDAEERVADAVVHGLHNAPPGHADADRLVPVDGGREIGRDELFDIVADLGAAARMRPRPGSRRGH